MKRSLSALAWIGFLSFLGSQFVLAADEPDPKSAVPQPLKVDGAESLALSWPSGVSTFRTQAELDGAVGQGKARPSRPVDFDKEDLIFVSWQSGGPPFGTLTFSVDAKNGVTFSVLEPPGRGPRGEALRMGADWFTIPKDVKATFAK